MPMILKVAQRFCWCASVAVICCTLGQSSAFALTLDQLAIQAFNHHPVTQAAAYEVQASRHDVEAARLARWPVFSATHDNYWNDRRTTFSVRQPLWDAGAIRSRIQQAKTQVAQNQAGVLLQRQQLAQRVLSAWSDYYTALYRQQLIQQQLSQLQDYAALMQRRVDAGVSAAIEQQLVLSRIQQTQVEQQSAISTQQIALDRLARLTGLAQVGQSLDLASFDQQFVTALARNLTAPALDSTAVHAQQHPSMLSAEYAIAAAQAAIVTQQAERWPRVYLQYQHRIDYPQVDIDDLGVAVGVEFATDRSIGSWISGKAAQSRLQVAQASQQASLELLNDELVSDYQQVVSLKLRLQSLQLAVESARLVEASYARQFSAGHKSWLEVLNALRETAQTEQALAEAQVSLVGLNFKLQMDQGVMNWQQIETTP